MSPIHATCKSGELKCNMFMITRSTFALCMATLMSKSVRSDTCLCLLVERRRARGYPSGALVANFALVYLPSFTCRDAVYVHVERSMCTVLDVCVKKYCISYRFSEYAAYIHSHRETRKTCLLCVFEKGPYLLRMFVGSRNHSPWQAFSMFVSFRLLVFRTTCPLDEGPA